MLQKLKIFFWSIILVIVLLGTGAVYLLLSGNNQPVATFVVKNGQGVNEISKNLYDQKLIKNKFVFETWLWLLKSENRVVAGIHDLPADVSIFQLTRNLMRLPSNTQASILIPEGYDRNMIAKVLDKNGLSGQDFLSATEDKKDWQEKYSFLSDAPKNATLEGYLFPDTYFTDRYTTVDDFIKKTLSNFDKKLTAELRAEIKRQNKSIYEVLILASIIEREVPDDHDKKMIADIFIKRMRDGMRLESDATINFITGKGVTQPTYADLELDSPYNTYRNDGLPPGPIANPGIASIEAALYPTSNNYYFFLTTKEGEVIYGRNYEEHLQNKAKHLD
ncbi:MAG: Endolytic murein transglycosylase [Patescibacteria group bacterium]|nr:Endolytic murein transglycosylase [Patescibacteria group bacterium]